MKRFGKVLSCVALLAVAVFCLFLLPTEVSAADESALTFSLNEDGESYSVTACDPSASGALEVPVTYKGKPVTGIGQGAFNACDGLTSVTIPDSVEVVGEGAFSGCSSLESMTIPFVGGSRETVTDTYQYPFGYVFGTSSYAGSVAVKQYYYAYTYSTYYIPGSLKSVTVTGGNISFGAFDGCSGLTSVVIPDGTTSIGTVAFRDCRALTEIAIPNSVEIIGDSAFCDCSGLTEITIPDSVTAIGSGAFYECGSLTSITIPDSVTSIGGGAFTDCSSLNYNIYDNGKYIGSETNPYLYLAKATSQTITSISIHPDTKMIAEWAFSYCMSLTSVTIPEGVTSIGGSAFECCFDLTTVNFNATNCAYVGNFEQIVFRDCNITTVKFGENVTNIPDFAFAYCHSLTSITIPDSVTRIGNSAFYDCGWLNTVYYGGTEEQRNQIIIWEYNEPLDAATWVYGSAGEEPGPGEEETCPLIFTLNEDGESYSVTDCDTSISGALEIPATYSGKPVTAIGDYAFEDCRGLTGITIPNSITTIGQFAFFNCRGLTELTIPSSVTEIKSSAFAQCVSLTAVTIPANVEFLSSSAFEECTGLETFQVDVNNPNYASFSGALYDKEMANLITVFCCNRTEITLPESVNCIYLGAFYGCTNLMDVYYEGSKRQAESIEIVEEDNGPLLNAVWYYRIADEEYTVVFQNWDGTVLSSQTYLAGDVVTAPADPTKAADNTYTYTFAGWDKEVVACAGDATYTAMYTPVYIDYTIIFQDEDGTELSKKTYHWGDAVTAPANPTKPADNTYTYTFKGWNNEVVNCAGDATYKAVFEKAYMDYTIIFQGEDGTELSKKTYHWGDVVTAPEAPTKPEDETYTYTFAGWDKEVVPCGGNAVYTAVYSSQRKDGLSCSVQEGQVTISGYVGTDTDVVIENTYTVEDQEYTVTEIGAGAFQNNTTVQTVTIPKTVTVVGAAAFAACSKLETVAIASNAEASSVATFGLRRTIGGVSVEEKAFLNCTSLKTVIIGETVVSIGENAFDGCTALEKVLYEGTEEQWKAIAIANGNEALLNANITYGYGKVLRGDLDMTPGVTDADAVYLLYHTFLPDAYPVSQDCDFNGDGVVTDQDAVYLLYHTFLPEQYPIG